MANALQDPVGFGGHGVVPFARPTNTSSGGTSVQGLWIENFAAHDTFGLAAYSNGTVSLAAVPHPWYLSLSRVYVLYRGSGSGTRTVQWGLYSLNGVSLSLANSASVSITPNGNTSTNWASLSISAAQNISHGQWWWALNVLSGGTSSFSLAINSSINPAGAHPGAAPLKARMTVSTNALPVSIDTTTLDITGSDAMRQPYILIGA